MIRENGDRYRLHPLVELRAPRLRQHPRGRPLVSVVIPNYNYARFLPGAIQSALSQDGVTSEVIVVDDASTDDSVDIATALTRQEPRLKVIARRANGGPVDTFNEGLAAASGEYLVRLDADDLLTPGSLGRSCALAEEFPSIGMVYGHPVHFEGPVPRRHRNRTRSWVMWPGLDWLELRCRMGVNCITSPEVLMRTSVVRRIGGQRDLAHTHDMEMWFRLARHSDVGWVGGCDQAWHREHADSRSARRVDVMTDLRERALAFEMLFTDGVGNAATDARLLHLGWSALANEAIARASSAYAKGRGGSPETDGYLDFACSLGVDLSSLPHSSAFEEARRLGRRRAPFSPYLFAHAAAYRLSRELGRPRWRLKGI